MLSVNTILEKFYKEHQVKPFISPERELDTWLLSPVNALQLHYSNAKLEATNNLIKLIKRNAFGFRNFENFKKRIFIALNIKKERTKFVLSRA
ncbi:transposase-like protein%2C IS1167 [Streptococcus pneumoniae]|uniref:transposase n=1 Tax=Streptococcus pneumoniae TaxID=1313 RepID=UPI0005E3A367|nr:transposase [Streptococcus pneumoniae]CJW27191.1 transposase-like protein%2C IS1167 [Streptococcus pneumoniae]